MRIKEETDKVPNTYLVYSRVLINVNMIPLLNHMGSSSQQNLYW